MEKGKSEDSATTVTTSLRVLQLDNRTANPKSTLNSIVSPLQSRMFGISLFPLIFWGFCIKLFALASPMWIDFPSFVFLGVIFGFCRIIQFQEEKGGTELIEFVSWNRRLQS